MAVLSDFNAKVAITVKDTAEIFTSADRDDFIEQAVRQYSRDKPRHQSALITGDGSAQEFATPAGWVDRFSVAVLLEHPVDEVPIRTLDLQDNFDVVLKSDVQKIQLPTLTLPAAETARLVFSSPHTVDGSGSSIPDPDFDAVCDLAASFLARGLAAFYAEETNSTIAADVVAGASRADTFARLARDLLKAYQEHITTGDVETGALMYHDRDIVSTWGRDLITHPRRWR